MTGIKGLDFDTHNKVQIQDRQERAENDCEGRIALSNTKQNTSLVVVERQLRSKSVMGNDVNRVK